MAALYKVKPSPVVTCRCEPANANHAKQKNVYSRFLFDNAICLSQNQKENKKFALLRPHFALITTYKSVPCRTHPHSLGSSLYLLNLHPQSFALKISLEFLMISLSHSKASAACFQPLQSSHSFALIPHSLSALRFRSLQFHVHPPSEALQLVAARCNISTHPVHQINCQQAPEHDLSAGLSLRRTIH